MFCILYSHTVRSPVCSPLALESYFAALLLSRHQSLSQVSCSDSRMELNTLPSIKKKPKKTKTQQPNQENHTQTKNPTYSYISPHSGTKVKIQPVLVGDVKRKLSFCTKLTEAAEWPMTVRANIRHASKDCMNCVRAIQKTSIQQSWLNIFVFMLPIYQHPEPPWPIPNYFAVTARHLLSFPI